MNAKLPPFPGAIAASHLRVYQSAAPDGLRGGTPHVHLTCTEAYYVVAGRGHVQTLTPQGFATTPLERGVFAWFTPGTVHRLVNEDGALEILVLMQNAGLPEAGDMVITFPPDDLADPASHARAARLPPEETTTSGSGAAARARRDRGVLGFGALKEALEREGPRALDTFYRRAAAIVEPQLARWRRVFEEGPRAAVERTAAQLAALERGDAEHLREASVYVHPPPEEKRRMGCCGTLGVYVAESERVRVAGLGALGSQPPRSGPRSGPGAGR